MINGTQIEEYDLDAFERGFTDIEHHKFTEITMALSYGKTCAQALISELSLDEMERYELYVEAKEALQQARNKKWREHHSKFNEYEMKTNKEVIYNYANLSTETKSCDDQNGTDNEEDNVHSGKRSYRSSMFFK